MTGGIAQFLDMGGYARFVWPAYGMAVIVLAGMAGAALRNWRRQKRALETLDRRQQAKRR
jgi:heme exporter protein D